MKGKVRFARDKYASQTPYFSVFSFHFSLFSPLPKEIALIYGAVSEIKEFSEVRD